MKVSSSTSLKKTVTPSKVKGGSVSSAGFEKELEKPAAPPVQGNFSVSTIDAIWAQQEVNENGERKKRQVKRAHRLIDHLEQIQQALLSNQLTKQQLINLQEALEREREEISDDEELAALLSDIELRAAVELAKYS